jgi:hypothetical protein
MPFRFPSDTTRLVGLDTDVGPNESRIHTIPESLMVDNEHLARQYLTSSINVVNSQCGDSLEVVNFDLTLGKSELGFETPNQMLSDLESKTQSVDIDGAIYPLLQDRLAKFLSSPVPCKQHPPVDDTTPPLITPTQTHRPLSDLHLLVATMGPSPPETSSSVLLDLISTPTLPCFQIDPDTPPKDTDSISIAQLSCEETDDDLVHRNWSQFPHLNHGLGDPSDRLFEQTHKFDSKSFLSHSTHGYYDMSHLNLQTHQIWRGRQNDPSKQTFFHHLDNLTRNLPITNSSSYVQPPFNKIKKPKPAFLFPKLSTPQHIQSLHLLQTLLSLGIRSHIELLTVIRHSLSILCVELSLLWDQVEPPFAPSTQPCMFQPLITPLCVKSDIINPQSPSLCHIFAEFRDWVSHEMDDLMNLHHAGEPTDQFDLFSQGQHLIHQILLVIDSTKMSLPLNIHDTLADLGRVSSALTQTTEFLASSTSISNFKGHSDDHLDEPLVSSIPPNLKTLINSSFHPINSFSSPDVSPYQSYFLLPQQKQQLAQILYHFTVSQGFTKPSQLPSKKTANIRWSHSHIHAFKRSFVKLMSHISPLRLRKRRHTNAFSKPAQHLPTQSTSQPLTDPPTPSPLQQDFSSLLSKALYPYPHKQPVFNTDHSIDWHSVLDNILAAPPCPTSNSSPHISPFSALFKALLPESLPCCRKPASLLSHTTKFKLLDEFTPTFPHQPKVLETPNDEQSVDSQPTLIQLPQQSTLLTLLPADLPHKLSCAVSSSPVVIIDACETSQKRNLVAMSLFKSDQLASAILTPQMYDDSSPPLTHILLNNYSLSVDHNPIEFNVRRNSLYKASPMVSPNTTFGLPISISLFGPPTPIPSLIPKSLSIMQPKDLPCPEQSHTVLPILFVSDLTISTPFSKFQKLSSSIERIVPDSDNYHLHQQLESVLSSSTELPSLIHIPVPHFDYLEHTSLLIQQSFTHLATHNPSNLRNPPTKFVHWLLSLSPRALNQSFNPSNHSIKYFNPSLTFTFPVLTAHPITTLQTYFSQWVSMLSSPLTPQTLTALQSHRIWLRQLCNPARKTSPWLSSAQFKQTLLTLNKKKFAKFERKYPHLLRTLQLARRFAVRNVPSDILSSLTSLILTLPNLPSNNALYPKMPSKPMGLLKSKPAPMAQITTKRTPHYQSQLKQRKNCNILSASSNPYRKQFYLSNYFNNPKKKSSNLINILFLESYHSLTDSQVHHYRSPNRAKLSSSTLPLLDPNLADDPLNSNDKSPVFLDTSGRLTNINHYNITPNTNNNPFVPPLERPNLVLAPLSSFLITDGLKYTTLLHATSPYGSSDFNQSSHHNKLGYNQRFSVNGLDSIQAPDQHLADILLYSPPLTNGYYQALFSPIPSLEFYSSLFHSHLEAEPTNSQADETEDFKALQKALLTTTVADHRKDFFSPHTHSLNDPHYSNNNTLSNRTTATYRQQSGFCLSGSRIQPQLTPVSDYQLYQEVSLRDNQLHSFRFMNNIAAVKTNDSPLDRFILNRHVYSSPLNDLFVDQHNLVLRSTLHHSKLRSSDIINTKPNLNSSVTSTDNSFRLPRDPIGTSLPGEPHSSLFSTPAAHLFQSLVSEIFTEQALARTST